MEEPFIVCDNLVKIYKVANLVVVALQGLDLIVRRGELLGMVGASGSGKSTLMNILGGLDRPSAGRVWVDGYDLLKLSDSTLDDYRRAKVGFIWQQGARNLVPYLTALENVMLPMDFCNVYDFSDRSKRARDLLDLVGVGNQADKLPASLSGGQQQRVAIARSLANDPALLVADEPTGNLDGKTAASVIDLFETLTQEGKTILMVTHDPDLARRGSRIVTVTEGQIES